VSDHLSRVTNLVGAGSLAFFVIPKILAACTQMHVTHSLNTVGFLEANRAVYNKRLRLAPPGVVDVTPSPEQIRTAIGYAGYDEFAETNRASWERLAAELVDKVVHTIEQRRLTGSQTLWVQGLRTGHAKPAEAMLSRLKEKVQDQFIVVKSTLPEDADQRPKAVGGYTLFHDLQLRKVVSVTILTDNASPFALAFKLSTQDAFEARALASVLSSLAQFGKSKGLAEVGRSLGEQGFFAGWSFRSEPLEPIKDGFGWGLTRAFNPKLPHRGQGNVAHIVHLARIATTKSITEPTARAIDEDIDFTKPMFIVYTVPIPLAERAQWETFSNELRRWLGVTYPNAVPIFASGAGTPDPRYSGSYWLQASTLFPLPDVPRPIREYVKPQARVSVPQMPGLGGGDTDILLATSVNGATPSFLNYIPGKDGLS
jgi:hypothetical protein